MLVATDVAARGIDVNSLAMVINYDLPNEAENYVHRIGRTARAGKTGKAYSFCSEQDVYNLPAIEKYIENKVPSCVPGEEGLRRGQERGQVYPHGPLRFRLRRRGRRARVSRTLLLRRRSLRRRTWRTTRFP